MKVAARLDNLQVIHPQLWWAHLSAAAVAVFVARGAKSPFDFRLAVQDVPGCDDDVLEMKLGRGRISDRRLAQLCRTYERFRLVEMAAIAIAGLGIYHAGGHIIHDVALHGTAADYLVDKGAYVLRSVVGPGAGILSRPGNKNGSSYCNGPVAISLSALPNLNSAPAAWHSRTEERMMATAEFPISDMLVTVKSREIQRGMLAEAARNKPGAAKHFLAAAHLELVLADDYEQASQKELAFRSRLSAASCLWRGGDVKRARTLFNSMLKQYPGKAKIIKNTIAELEGKRS